MVNGYLCELDPIIQFLPETDLKSISCVNFTKAMVHFKG